MHGAPVYVSAVSLWCVCVFHRCSHMCALICVCVCVVCVCVLCVCVCVCMCVCVCVYVCMCVCVYVCMCVQLLWSKLNSGRRAPVYDTFEHALQRRLNVPKLI